MSITKTKNELIWLGHLVSEVQMKEIESIRIKAKVHDRFWLSESILGEHGFKPLTTVQEQAFCQVLCHEGCIASGLLFGFSLSSYYKLSRRVLLEAAAFDYCFICLEFFLLHHREPNFAEAAEFLNGTDVLYQICLFVLKNKYRLDKRQQSHAVFQFCDALTRNVHHHICH